MALAKVDGVELEYETRGEGEPVVLVHAALCAHWFKPLLDEPALGRYRLIRYDRAGYGGSTRASGAISAAEQAAHCRALLRELGIERAHVVGHSSGGVIAIQLALDAPQAVQSLALLEPAIPTPSTSSAVTRAVHSPAIERYLAGDLAGAVDLFMRGVAGPDWSAAMDRGLRGGIDLCVADAPTFFSREMPGLREWSFTRDDAARVRQPVLAVIGEKSDAVRPGNSVALKVFQHRHELLLSWLPRVEAFVLPGATHLLQVENPRGMAEGLAAFFAKHPIALQPS